MRAAIRLKVQPLNVDRPDHLDPFRQQVDLGPDQVRGLKSLLAEGKTILLTTHFMDEAERLCGRLAVMDHGRMIASGSPRELVDRHIEPQVVEVFGDSAENWARDHGAQLAERCESAGETVFCYVHDATHLIDDLAARPELRYVHRPANLEDVFLRLTGRDLRD